MQYPLVAHQWTWWLDLHEDNDPSAIDSGRMPLLMGSKHPVYMLPQWITTVQYSHDFPCMPYAEKSFIQVRSSNISGIAKSFLWHPGKSTWFKARFAAKGKGGRQYGVHHPQWTNSMSCWAAASSQTGMNIQHPGNHNWLVVYLPTPRKNMSQLGFGMTFPIFLQ